MVGCLRQLGNYKSQSLKISGKKDIGMMYLGQRTFVQMYLVQYIYTMLQNSSRQIPAKSEHVKLKDSTILPLQ